MNERIATTTHRLIVLIGQAEKKASIRAVRKVHIYCYHFAHVSCIVIFKRSPDTYTVAINRVVFVHGTLKNCDSLREEKIVIFIVLQSASTLAERTLRENNSYDIITI